MQNLKRSVQLWCGPFISALAMFLFVGCQSGKDQCCDKTQAPATPAAVAPAPAVTPAPAAAPAVAPAMTAAPAAPTEPAAPTALVASPEAPPARPTIRISAGASTSYTNSDGEVWLADQGFVDGDTTERASDLPIANTKDPIIYRTERYGMTAFSYKLPNGKYTVKLHFAETYEGITGPGQRVFSFKVQGHEFKDFDVWAKTGGTQRADVETAEVDITEGKLDITFDSKAENPEINGIEILPVP
jgi:hypothetical protein